MIVLSQGQKVRKSRKDLQITQQELACNGISRSLIAQIESEKIKKEITPMIANILANRLNTLALNKKIEFNITAEYLLQNDTEQVKNELEKIKKSLIENKEEKNFKKLILTAEELFSTYEIDNLIKVEIYNIAIDYYNGKDDFQEMEKYIWSNISIYLEQKDKLNVIKSFAIIIAISYSLEKFENVITLTKILESNYKINDKHILLSIYFNASLAAFELCKYRDCLKYLENLSKLKLSKEKELWKLTVKANALSQLKKLDKAEKIYLDIINNSDKNIFFETIANSYSNLSDLEMGKGNAKKAEFYIKKALKIRNINNKQYLLNIFLNAFLVSLMNNYDLEKIIYYFNKVNNQAIEMGKIKIQDMIYNKILDYFIYNNLDNELMNLILRLNEYEKVSFNASDIFYRAAEYLESDSKSILKMGMKFLKYNKINKNDIENI